MSKYVTKRQDVCAGELLRTGGFGCRGMLFNVDGGLAHDLIYTTPTNYPIKDIEPKIVEKSGFIIDHYVELDELLKYLKYGVDLTQDDLNRIYRKLITHRWWLEHHRELFGFKKMGNNMGYCSGGIEIISMETYNKLDDISFFKNGKPSKEEPCYSLIKRRR